MTRRFLLVPLSLGMLLGATPILARDPATPAGPPPIALFEAADLNHDGTLTRRELDTHRSALFAQFDRNHDGKLSGTEIDRMEAQRKAAQPPAPPSGKPPQGQPPQGQPPQGQPPKGQPPQGQPPKAPPSDDAHAPKGGHTPPAPDAAQQMPTRAALMARDRNHDGAISQQEFLSTLPQWWPKAHHDSLKRSALEQPPRR